MALIAVPLALIQLRIFVIFRGANATETAGGATGFGGFKDTGWHLAAAGLWLLCSLVNFWRWRSCRHKRLGAEYTLG